VVHNAGGADAGAGGQAPPLATIARECSFALQYIERAPHNESPWNYLRGYFVVDGATPQQLPQVRESTWMCVSGWAMLSGLCGR
jgi:hypothetical protein